MKSIIFLISFLFVGQLQAQDTTFKYVKTNEKKALAGLKSVMNSSAFVLNERTAAENYEIVYSYIASKYEYPEDVLMSNTPGIELTIQETIPGLYTMKSMGFVNSFAMRYAMSFKTSDGNIECSIASMQLENPVTISQNMEKEWNAMDGLYLHRKNGKPKKTMLGITDIKIENHFNAILQSLKGSN
tara:strand:- start:990 stop:1547 length:558 start_codon:yes stop_codon:yes gene_type:complete